MQAPVTVANVSSKAFRIAGNVCEAGQVQFCALVMVQLVLSQNPSTTRMLHSVLQPVPVALLHPQLLLLVLLALPLFHS